MKLTDAKAIKKKFIMGWINNDERLVLTFIKIDEELCVG